MQYFRTLIRGLLALTALNASFAFSDDHLKSLTLTMTNDPLNNVIQVYETLSHELLQTLPTGGKGGVTGNGFGIKQYNNRIFASVNYGSNTVSVFERDGDKLYLKTTLRTSSAPVSIDFGKDHMYVAGDTTVDSFSFKDCDFELDGTMNLALASGGSPAAGDTAQVGVVQNYLLVTIKTDPTPGTVDIVFLRDSGAVSGDVSAVSGPTGSLTPFGFSVLADGTALITLAHSNQLGLFRNEAFVDVINSGGQAAPCWATPPAGKYVFTINTGSKTVSREVTSGENIFVDAPVALTIASGNPTDSDQYNGNMAIVSHNATTSFLNFIHVNDFGELSFSGTPVDLGVTNANGVAIMSP